MRRTLAVALTALGLALPLPAVLTGYSLFHASQSATAANAGTRRACPGTVVTVHGREPVGCDLTPSQRLDVTGVTLAECEHMGGTPTATTCQDVDY